MEGVWQFISNFTYLSVENDNIGISACDFNKAHYHPDYYEALDIEMPEQIKTSVEKRQAEFLVGRYLAAEALKRQGCDPWQAMRIPVGPHRNPLWPEGFLGTISHNHNKVLSIVSRDAYLSLLGADIESILDDKSVTEISTQVHDESETSVLMSNGLSQNESTTLIFSAKETIFKALYTSVGEYFGFEVCKVIDVDINNGQLHIEFIKKFSQAFQIESRYIVNFVIFEGCIYTALLSRR